MRETVTRRTILLGLCALLAAGVAHDACAQRRGGGGPGVARGGHGFSRARVLSPYGYGSAYFPYDYGDAYPYDEPQPAVFVQQPPAAVEPPAPPVAYPRGHAVIREYTWPAAASASSSGSSTGIESETQTFALVLKDGSTLSAVMVFASEDGLHYVDPDERHLCISMSKVDRAATLKLNRARNLNLYLPAAE